jgi:hypothetical protein
MRLVSKTRFRSPDQGRRYQPGVALRPVGRKIIICHGKARQKAYAPFIRSALPFCAKT